MSANMAIEPPGDPPSPHGEATRAAANDKPASRTSPPDTIDAFSTSIQRLRLEREARFATNLAAIGDASIPCAFRRPHTSLLYIVHRSARLPGKVQVTRLDDGVPAGHDDFDTPEQAALTLVQEEMIPVPSAIVDAAVSDSLARPTLLALANTAPTPIRRPPRQ
jgi:hypothetical protein